MAPSSGGRPDGDDEAAWRKEVIHRSICKAVAEYAFRSAEKLDGKVYGGPKWTVSPVYEGMLKEEMDAAAERHPEVAYEPLLIDATYAGLITGRADAPLVIPALNRDGDLLSDLVLPLFGSIAGAESILLALDEDLSPSVAMAEAPHGTAPALEGKDVANPMAMILAVGALLGFAGERGDEAAAAASAAIYEAVMETTAAGSAHPRPQGPRLDHRVHRRGDRAVREARSSALERPPITAPRPGLELGLVGGADPLGDQAVLDHERRAGLGADAVAAFPLARALGQLEGGDREVGPAPPRGPARRRRAAPR